MKGEKEGKEKSKRTKYADFDPSLSTFRKTTSGPHFPARISLSVRLSYFFMR